MCWTFWTQTCFRVVHLSLFRCGLPVITIPLLITTQYLLLLVHICTAVPQHRSDWGSNLIAEHASPIEPTWVFLVGRLQVIPGARLYRSMQAASNSSGFIICQASDQGKWSKTLSGFFLCLTEWNSVSILCTGQSSTDMCTRGSLQSPHIHFTVTSVFWNGAVRDSGGVYWCTKNIKRSIYNIIDWPFSLTEFIKTINIH